MLKGGLALIWELDMNLEPTLIHSLQGPRWCLQRTGATEVNLIL